MPLVRLIPDPRPDDRARRIPDPRALVELQLGHARLMEGVDQLAIDIELQLRVRGIADPHRPRAFIAGQPVRLPFQQAALTHDAVHDLHMRRRAGRRAQQPIVPAQGFLGVAAVHQRQQREGGIAQPAEAVIPVARAAEFFRQRGRRCGDDAAGRQIGQRLQRDQRPHHEIAAIALIGAAAAPLGPELLGVLQGLRGIDRFGDRQMRRPVGQHERYGFAFAHFEIGHRGQVFAAGLDRRPQHRHVAARKSPAGCHPRFS